MTDREIAEKAIETLESYGNALVQHGERPVTGNALLAKARELRAELNPVEMNLAAE